MNPALGKTYLAAHDAKLITRTWSEVMADLTTHGRESSQARSSREMQGKPYDLIRNKKLIETTAEDLKAVLAAGGASTNNYLRRLHNLALELGWLPWPILPPKLWPKVRPKIRHGITREEHEKIVGAELNLERKLYYEMLWELGAAQTGTSRLTAENIDWKAQTVVYKRQKLDGSSEPACMTIGTRLEEILKQLPSKGALFPRWSQATASDRSSEFSRRCRTIGVSGVSLHSYRYAWAERAREAGYPERWAQADLGHNSRAVHQAYAKGARVVCPALEDYEKKIIVLPDQIAKRVA